MTDARRVASLQPLTEYSRVGTFPMGRIEGMSHETYLAVPALSNSGLKRLRKSPWHYRAVQDGEHPDKEPTPAMFGGTLTHAALLELDEFDLRYVTGPDVSKLTKEWKTLAAGLGVAKLIDAVQEQIALAQAASLRGHPKVAELWRNYPGDSEVSLFWIDGDTGTYCKARVDRAFRANEGAILLDVKTGAEMTVHGFRNAAWRFGYHTQAAWYTRGWEAVTGEPVLGFMFAACENEYPYAATTFMFSDAILAKAQQLCDRLLALHRRCEDANDWPGYPEMQLIDDLPEWATA